ncbi:MAG: SusC/RagA family TonB-linked outer membrane protein [Ferruginibacter sp.]|nr:SusC/RagA family TonB-linked outer membrane protein [Ferruginibacter sp.]
MKLLFLTNACPNTHRAGFAKLLRIMKLTTFLMLVAGLYAKADGYSQKISLSLENASVENVFKKISDQSEYYFLYTNKVVKNAKPISISVKNASIEEVLKICFEGQPLTFTIYEKTVVIKLKKVVSIGEHKSDPAPPAPLIEINGTVVNDKGEPMAGVSVHVKNTGTGVMTDANGNYHLTVPSEKSVLEFSFVGYVGKTIAVGESRRLDIVLSMEDKKLDNIVVVGYGTQRQKDLTGSVSAISSKDFNPGVVLSPQQSIQGKLAGVNISQNSGKPGGSNTVRVRGGTSITSSNDPLYVIDGVPISNSAGIGQANINNYGIDIFDEEPTNPLMTLNPDDIESVTVLKDASSTAIYGSRGANGVIVITTKKGTAGKAKVSVGMSGGISKVAGMLDVLSADQYRQKIKDLGLTIDDKGANTNWQDKIFRTGHSQDHYLSMSGGADKTTYRASLGYGDQQGVMLASDIKRANARINITHSELKDKLTFDLRINYGQTFTKQAPVSNTVGSEFGSSMNYEALVFNPTYPVYDPSGNYYFVPPYRVNPVSYSDQVLDQVTNNRFLGNLSTTLKIVKPLSFNVNIGYTNQNINRNSFISKNNLLGQGSSGYASVQKLEDYSKLLETILRYTERFGKHSIEALAGYSWQYFVNEGDRTSAQGFLSDEFKWYSLQAASTISSVSTFKGSNKLVSFYGRANYNFDDRFLVTATVRRDGSSRFGTDNKWGLFPSGSVAWRISKEDFFQGKAISDLKIRVSYGITGNQEIGNLNSITTLGATTTGYIVGGQRITTVLPQQYANPNLKWEQTGQFDAGIDYALFGGRLHGSIDYYIKKTTDLLLSIPVPSPTAVSTQLANVGSVQNKGVEIDIAGKIIDKSDFRWESSFNISFNRNKVLSLSNEQFSGKNIQIGPLQGTVSLGKFAQLIIPGQAVGTFWGPQFTGIKGGKETYAAGADTIIGTAQPKYIFGFTNTFGYKKFALNFLFRGSVGNDVFNLTAANMSYLSNLPGKNVLASSLTSGLDRDAPKVYSSRWIEDGSFVRLENVTLSYALGLKNTFINSANIFLSGQNLWLISNYSGVDPEVNAEVSRTGIAPLGIDYLGYPRARTISLGFNVTF